jgi:hypothetical protein
MGSKRFARLSNGFSKKIDCHLAAVNLYVAFYNFCRTPEALRMTPAMALGITDRVWSIGDLIEADGCVMADSKLSASNMSMSTMVARPSSAM